MQTLTPIFHEFLWLFLTATAALKGLPDNKALKQSSLLQVFLSTVLIKEVQRDA